MGGPVEYEIKVKCDDFDRLVANHPDLGWEVVEPRHFEDNLVFDLPDAALENRGSILRLRVVAGRATLTFKGLVPESATSHTKAREELETDVDDPDTLARILERLGMKRVFRYQKYRAVYEIDTGKGKVLAMRDELPFGDFLEIEGDENLVEEVARTLGFSESQHIRESYIAIQAAMCRARGRGLEDLVFAVRRESA